MPRARSQFVLLYLLFFVTGTATVLEGVLLPALPSTAPDADLRLATALAVQFTGQLLGPLVPWRKPAIGVACGCAITAATALLLTLVHGVAYWPSLFLYGFGLGVTMTMTNVLVGVESTAADRTSRLELLNIFWPLGAACCAPLVLHIPMDHRASWPYVLLATLFAGAALLLLRRDSAATQPVPLSEPAGAAWQPARLLTLAALALLAVGIEAGLANWLPTFDARYLAHYGAVLPLSALFWVGILGGRSLAAWLFRERSASRWATPACAALYAVAVAVLLGAGSSVAVFPATLLASMAVAPIYPALLSEAVSMRGKGIVFSMAGVGSALLPWGIGKLSSRTHSLRLGLSTLLVAAVLLGLGFLWEQRMASAPSTRHQP